MSTKEDDLYNITEAALYINISRPTIYKFIEAGMFPLHAIIFKGRKYWDGKTLRDWKAKSGRV